MAGGLISAGSTKTAGNTKMVAGPASASPTTIVNSWNSAAFTGGTTTATLTIPSGKSAAVGDVLVVFINAGASGWTAPSSSGVTWTLQTTASTCCGYLDYTFTGVVTSVQTAGTNYVFTGTVWVNAQMADFTGVDTVTLLDPGTTLALSISGTNAHTDTINATLPHAGDMVVICYSNDNAWSITPPAAYSVIQNNSSGWGMINLLYPSAQSTGALTFSVGNTETTTYHFLALKALGS